MSSRLWRRYGEAAILLTEHIQEDPGQAEVLIKETEYVRCEIYEASQSEMIVKLEDFLHSRSKTTLVERIATIKKSPGLIEAC